MRTTLMVGLVVLASAATAGCGKKKSDDGDNGETPVVSDAAAQAATEEYWKGTIELPGMPLAFGLTLAEEDGAWSGTIDIPMQKAEGLELSAVERDGSKLSFELLPPGAPESAKATIALEIDGDSASGTMAQGGQSIEVTAEKVDEAADLPQAWKRPQTPEPPFPYESRDVTYESKDGTKLAGTLTIPKGDGPHAAVLLISGSGQQDRDETIFEHKPFLVLADHLTRKGFAVLRYDDRGVGGSGGDPQSMTIQDEIADAKAGFEFLTKQEEIDPKRVGLIGHSVGGMIAPAVAAQGADVKFIIALAAPAVSGEALVPMQLEAALRASEEDLSDDAISAIVEQQEKVMKAVAAGKSSEEIEPILEEAHAISEEHGATGLGPKPNAAELSAQIKGQAAGVTSPWYRSFVKLDPAPYWKKASVPTLALYGGKDIQVPAEANEKTLKVIAQAVGNDELTTRVLPELNHLFQTAETGRISEYAELEETFDPETLTLIDRWVLVAAGAPGGGGK